MAAKQKSKIGPFTAAMYNAEIAAAVIDGAKEAPDGTTWHDYALYLIARSLASLAGALDEQAVISATPPK